MSIASSVVGRRVRINEDPVFAGKEGEVWDCEYDFDISEFVLLVQVGDAFVAVHHTDLTPLY